MLSSAEANAGMESMGTHQQGPQHSYGDVEDARMATTPYAETVLPSSSPRFSTAQEDGESTALLRMPGATVLGGVPGQEGESAVDAPQQPAPAQEKATERGHEPVNAFRTQGSAKGMPPSSAGASQPIAVSQPVMRPQQHVPFPEPPFAWARPVAMPEPELPAPQPIAMPVPSVPMQQHSLDGLVLSDSPPLVVISPPAMAMPEPSILRESRLQQFLSMPTPDVPNYTPISPAATAIPQVVPDTTYDPASLHVPEWTYTQTPAERADGTEYAAYMHRIRLVLQTIPMHVRKSLGREEVIRIVLEALESEQEQGNERKEEFGTRQPWPSVSEEVVYGAAGTEALVGLTEPEWTTPLTDNEWYAIHGGGVLPPGECGEGTRRRCRLVIERHAQAGRHRTTTSDNNGTTRITASFPPSALGRTHAVSPSALTLSRARTPTGLQAGLVHCKHTCSTKRALTAPSLLRLDGSGASMQRCRPPFSLPSGPHRMQIRPPHWAMPPVSIKHSRHWCERGVHWTASATTPACEPPPVPQR